MSKKVHKKIPVIREALADLDTPLSVYLKLANEPFTYLLESAQVGRRRREVGQIFNYWNAMPYENPCRRNSNRCFQ